MVVREQPDRLLEAVPICSNTAGMRSACHVIMRELPDLPAHLKLRQVAVGVDAVQTLNVQDRVPVKQFRIATAPDMTTTLLSHH